MLSDRSQSLPHALAASPFEEAFCFVQERRIRERTGSDLAPMQEAAE